MAEGVSGVPPSGDSYQSEQAKAQLPASGEFNKKGMGYNVWRQQFEKMFGGQLTQKEYEQMVSNMCKMISANMKIEDAQMKRASEHLRESEG